MAAKQIQLTTRLQGDTGTFGPLSVRDFTLNVQYGDVIEKTFDVPTTMLDHEVSFASFQNGEAIFVVVRASANAADGLKVRINTNTGPVVTLPSGGMFIAAGSGVTSLYISGGSVDTEVYIMAAGA